MTEEQTTPAEPPPFAARYGLVRPEQGRHIAGVGAALGRATRSDPVLWRVVLAVLVCFAGLGLLIYLLLWLLTPADGDTASPLESLIGRGNSHTSPVLTGVLGLITVGLLAVILPQPFYLMLGTALALVVALLINRARTSPAGSAPPPGPAPGYPAGPGTPWAGPGPTGPAPGGPATTGPAFAGPATAGPAPAGGWPAWAPGPVPPAAANPAGPPADAPVGAPVDAVDPGTPGAPAPQPADQVPPLPAVAPVVDGPLPGAGSPMPGARGPLPGAGSPMPPAGPGVPGPAAAGPGMGPGVGPAGYRPPFAPHGPFAPQGPYPPYGPYAGVGPTPPPRPPRERSTLPAIAFFTAVLALGVLGGIDLLESVSIPVAGYVAAALAVLGSGLLVGAWFGRARMLIALGAALILVLPGAHALDSWERPEYFADEFFWAPETRAELEDQYDLMFGSGVLDLRQLDLAARDLDVAVDVSFGEVRIMVPEDVALEATVDTRFGNARVLGELSEGITDDTIRHPAVGDPQGGTLRLDLDVRFGHIEVQR